MASIWVPVTIALIIINVAIFTIENAFDISMLQYFLVPVYLIKMPERYIMTSFTSMFLHANAVHIAFNMFALFSMGRIMEPHIGSAKFLLIYIISGLAGGALHTAYSLLTNSEIFTPVVGASGAISGVLGIAAALGDRYALFWIMAQIPLAVVGFSSIAYFAHIGGFVAGFLAGKFIVHMGRKDEGYRYTF